MKITFEAQLNTYVADYENLIFSICYRLLGDYFEAQDVAQETFLAAYKNLATFDGKNPKAWLTRIATNKCLDFLKSKARTIVPTEDSILDSNPSAIPELEDQYTQNCTMEALKAACASLKEPYATAALCYYYHDMPVAKIAERTGNNPKTVQTHIYRAREMLKKLMREELYV